MIPNLTDRHFDHYRLLDEIGRGGMGVVYRAWDERMDRLVAVKVLAPFLSGDEEFVERFRREARLAGQLRKHPNIVTIYTFGEAEGLHYIAMEYLPGLSLARRIKLEGPMEPDRAVGIIRQVAEALDEAHGAGIVHRDVKPGNVIVGDDSHVTLTDFGLVYSAQLSRLSTTHFLGTPAYMAPEQAGGLGHVTPAVDQYALATVAYELLTGVVPAESAEPPSQVLARQGLPRPVAEALRRGRAQQPEQRFPSIGAFAEALERAVAAAPSPRTRHESEEGAEAVDPDRAQRRRTADRVTIAMAVLALAFAVALVFLVNEGVDKPLNAANARSTVAAEQQLATSAANQATAERASTAIAQAEVTAQALETAEAGVAESTQVALALLVATQAAPAASSVPASATPVPPTARPRPTALPALAAAPAQPPATAPVPTAAPPSVAAPPPAQYSAPQVTGSWPVCTSYSCWSKGDHGTCNSCGSIWLEWEWPGNLAAGESFEVWVLRTGNPGGPETHVVGNNELCTERGPNRRCYHFNTAVRDANHEWKVRVLRNGQPASDWSIAQNFTLPSEEFSP